MKTLKNSYSSLNNTSITDIIELLEHKGELSCFIVACGVKDLCGTKGGGGCTCGKYKR